MGTTMSKSGSNLLDALPAQNNLHVVMLGLDSAGKSTALYRLKFEQYLNTVPTIGFNCEKIQGTRGKAKGVQFLVWDVGGQEKLRPLWRSYTRCTDGILFVVDSVDVERMEEAKIELMRTAKCPDNQGVPVLILANKQDLPGARDPKELEKLLGLNELQYPYLAQMVMSSTSISLRSCPTPSVGKAQINNCENSIIAYPAMTSAQVYSKSVCDPNCGQKGDLGQEQIKQQLQLQSDFHQNADVHSRDESEVANPSSAVQQSPPYNVERNTTNGKVGLDAKTTSTTPYSQQQQQQYYRGWHIQPACAITGEGLQEGLEALYEMIARRRKHNRALKKKR